MCHNFLLKHVIFFIKTLMSYLFTTILMSYLFIKALISYLFTTILISYLFIKALISFYLLQY